MVDLYKLPMCVYTHKNEPNKLRCFVDKCRVIKGYNNNFALNLLRDFLGLKTN